MWHLFEREFRSLWSAAVKEGHGGELALDVLFGPKAPAGTQTLEVWLLCVCDCQLNKLGHKQLLSIPTRPLSLSEPILLEG